MIITDLRTQTTTGSGAGLRTETGVLVPVGTRGLDGPALDAVAAEARVRGTGIDLVHVVHVAVGVPAGPDQVMTVDRSLSVIGREVLTSAATALRGRLGDDVPVETEVLFGPVVPTLVDRSADADVVVLLRRDLGRAERLVTGSVSNGVAAKAHVPVLSLPPDWHRSTRLPPVVTAAVDHPDSSTAEVRVALERAARTGAALRVLRAAWLPEPYQGVVFQQRTREECLAAARHELEELTRPLVADEPGVSVTWDVVWARPADALVTASRRSDLLVVGRRHPSLPLGSHLGPVTRSVLRHSLGPVLVVESVA